MIWNKPLIALPYYQLDVINHYFAYLGIQYGSWNNPEGVGEYWPRRDVVIRDLVEEKNTQIKLIEHSFDEDSTLTARP